MQIEGGVRSARFFFLCVSELEQVGVGGEGGGGLLQDKCEGR